MRLPKQSLFSYTLLRFSRAATEQKEWGLTTSPAKSSKKFPMSEFGDVAVAEDGTHIFQFLYRSKSTSKF